MIEPAGDVDELDAEVLSLKRRSLGGRGSMAKTSVGIFIFNDVEVLDFAGPFEVFSRTRLVPGAQSRRLD